MSSSFYITPYDPKAWKDPDDKSEKPSSDLKINREQFRSALFEHWSPNRIQEDNKALIDNVWVLANPLDGEIAGLCVHLQDNHQVVNFNTGPKYVLLEFVLWYRKFIPVAYPLYFFHSSAWDALQLITDTTEQDLIDFTGIQE